MDKELIDMHASGLSAAMKKAAKDYMNKNIKNLNGSEIFKCFEFAMIFNLLTFVFEASFLYEDGDKFDDLRRKAVEKFHDLYADFVDYVFKESEKIRNNFKD